MQVRGGSVAKLRGPWWGSSQAGGATVDKKATIDRSNKERCPEATRRRRADGDGDDDAPPHCGVAKKLVFSPGRHLQCAELPRPEAPAAQIAK